MRNALFLTLSITYALLTANAHGQEFLPVCPSETPDSSWTDCYGAADMGENRYIGGWQNGLIHGSGAMRSGDGSTYKGGFFQGKRSGQGTLTSKEGYTLVDGIWYGDDHVHARGAAWRILGYSIVGLVLISPDPNPQTGAVRTTWIADLLSSPVKLGGDHEALSFIGRYKFDCVNKKLLMLSKAAYSNYFGSGKKIYEENIFSEKEQDWESVFPDTSLNYTALEYVCK